MKAFRKLHQFILGLIMAFVLVGAVHAEADNGGKEGHGGDACALEFTGLAWRIALNLNSRDNSYLFSMTNMIAAVVNTRVECVDQRLVLKGLEKDAINFSNQKLIVVNRQRWAELKNNPREQLLLVFHEYLGIMRVEMDDYSLTALLMGVLEDLIPKVPANSVTVSIEAYNDLDILMTQAQEKIATACMKYGQNHHKEMVIQESHCTRMNRDSMNGPIFCALSVTATCSF